MFPASRLKSEMNRMEIAAVHYYRKRESLLHRKTKENSAEKAELCRLFSSVQGARFWKTTQIFPGALASIVNPVQLRDRCCALL